MFVILFEQDDIIVYFPTASIKNKRTMSKRHLTYFIRHNESKSIEIEISFDFSIFQRKKRDFRFQSEHLLLISSLIHYYRSIDRLN